MNHTHISKNGTGSVLHDDTNRASQRKTASAAQLLTAALVVLLVGFVGTSNAATVFSGQGLTLVLSQESMEASVTWQSPTSGNLLVGANKLKSVDFGAIDLVSTSSVQKVAAGGIGKVAAGGIGKVAAGGIGKVAAGGIGKVAAGGIGKDKEEGSSSLGSFEFVSSDNGLIAILSIVERGTKSEYVFELANGTINNSLRLLEEFHVK